MTNSCSVWDSVVRDSASENLNPLLQVVQVEDQRQVDTMRLSAMRLGSTADFGRQFLDGADAPTSPMAMA